MMTQAPSLRLAPGNLLKGCGNEVEDTGGLRSCQGNAVRSGAVWAGVQGVMAKMVARIVLDIDVNGPGRAGNAFVIEGSHGSGAGLALVGGVNRCSRAGNGLDRDVSRLFGSGSATYGGGRGQGRSGSATYGDVSRGLRSGSATYGDVKRGFPGAILIYIDVRWSLGRSKNWTIMASFQ